VTSGYPTPVDIWYETSGCSSDALSWVIRPVTIEDQMDILSLALTDHMTETGVYCYTKFRRVKTSKGTEFQYIAFASNNPLSERLPNSVPSEERYKTLKEVQARLVGTELFKINRQ
jgi:hypothetical protein